MNKEAIDNFKIKRGIGSNTTKTMILKMLMPQISNFSILLRFVDDEDNIYQRAYSKKEMFGRGLSYLECHNIFYKYTDKKMKCETFRCFFISSVDFGSCE